MDDLSRMEESRQQKSDSVDTTAQQNPLRRKPGPEKKENPRSEKISCRLTVEEKMLGEEFCKKRGISEAKLLRACYLAIITHTPDQQLTKAVHVLLPLDDMDLSPEQQHMIKIKAHGVLKKSAMLLLLILLGCATVQPIIKFIYNGYNRLALHSDEVCIWHPGEIGCIAEKRLPQK